MAATYRRDRDDDADEAWEDDRYARERPRKGLFRRIYGLLKFALFVTPLALFLYGSFADCRARPAFTGWLDVIGAGACARNEIVGNASSMQDNFAILRRLVN
ncbi:hypothetical protein Q8W71_31030 [Methylobacterium sp. NEAU 140]|uniref:hypothetical protein n=1 Tax=Methylobacterium sp. NEAU 140 TaxID=3064945 RepID=UPI002733EDF7|nr:hypothetical protein [Methylobacterium sp. NEAU 140]MDP4027026.1 hypothetical protein [Methylobacterium sp. NEAU 140]